MQRVYLTGLKLFSCLLPLGLIMSCYSNEIVAVLLGEQWLAAAPALSVFLVSIYFRVCLRINESVLNAVGAVYRKAWRQMVYLILIIVFSIIGCQWGIIGVAGGVVLAIVITYILTTGLVLTITQASLAKYAGVHKISIMMFAAVAMSNWALHHQVILRTVANGILFVFMLVYMYRLLSEYRKVIRLFDDAGQMQEQG